MGRERNGLPSVTEAVATDDDLVELAREGDRRSFGRLVRRHDPAMRRLAFRLLGSRAAMDDALQDAYLKAFRSLGGFDGRSQFSTWLFTITYRTCVDHLRAHGRRRELDLDGDSDVAMLAASGDPGDIAVTRIALRRALRALPPDQAAVVVLVDGEGRSYDDVAEILEISAGTVGSRLSRARATLRERLSVEPGGGRP